MFTLKKRHLRKKRFFLSEQKTFALFNPSNLKASQIQLIRLSSPNAKLYFVPLFLKPPKLARGYPLAMIIYEKLEDIQTSLYKVTSNIDFIGVSINNQWYSTELFKKDNITNLEKKFLALLLSKKNYK